MTTGPGDAQEQPRILVIRLSALGDFVQSFGPFEAIRRAHPTAHITLLTTRPFVELARLAPWFDHVEVDTRPRWTDLAGVRALRRQLQGYDRVYDLQTSGRTARYFWLAGRPVWSGHVAAAALPHANPWRDIMHTRPRQRDQLRMAGVAPVDRPDLAWLVGGGPRLPPPYALLVPGAAPHRPEKRWPAGSYGQLAALLVARGITPVIVGSADEQPLAVDIMRHCPRARDLTGQTSLPDLAGLAARAWGAVGNDTGPMHLAAEVGCRCLVLFSHASTPARTAPLGYGPGQVEVLWARDLTFLSPQRVAAALW